MDYKILSTINTPDDVKKLNSSETELLCKEIRDCIIETVSKNGGHLASNLGVVELTVALHRTFSSPNDAIIFDVGHQCYAHKLLTGRFDRFSTIRKEGGLSGFMRPSESEHDQFVTGHSSNSISAAYGIYKAKAIIGEAGTAVAVIGDGAMTGGMAYEALNNAGEKKGNFIVVLNDNKMSISRNVGAMARSFTRLRNRRSYHRFKFAVGGFLQKIPLGKPIYNFIFHIKEGIKSIIYPNNIFTGLGFNYLGPVNGHDVDALEKLLKIAKDYHRPSLVHVVTVKGKGYHYAENKPNNYHGVSPFDIEKGASKFKNNTFSDVVGDTLCELAQKNDKICAITAAMTEGTGLSQFARSYKNRFFDVGIAEQHAVTFSAGLAKGGMIPYFVVYSTFLQRGFDQVLHDAAIAHLPVKFLIDRAGIVGDDGESHQGIFDTAYLTQIPGISVYSPYCYAELKKMINTTADNDELCAIRYPRGCENCNFDGDLDGDFTVVKKSGKRAIITYGRIFSNAVDAQKQLDDTDIIKLNKIYPLGSELINLLLSYAELYFFEEGIKSGGIGEHVGCRLIENGYKGKYSLYAVDNEFVPSATVTSSLEHYNLDSDSMIKIVRNGL